MTIDVAESIREAVDRVTTPLGALLLGLFAITGTLSTIGQQDVLRVTIDELVASLEQMEAPDEQTAEAFAQLQTDLQRMQSDLHLAMGLDQGTATALWAAAFLASLVVVALAIRAFGRDASSPGDLETDGLGWTVLNLVMGWIAYGVLVAIGFVLLVLPSVVIAIVLLYFPVAVVLDDEWFGAAFGSSVSVFREHVLETVLVVLAIVAAYVVLGVVGALLGAPLPDTAGALVEQVLRALAWLFTLALLTRSYVAGRDEAARSTDETLTEWEGRDDAI